MQLIYKTNSTSISSPYNYNTELAKCNFGQLVV